MAIFENIKEGKWSFKINERPKSLISRLNKKFDTVSKIVFIKIFKKPKHFLKNCNTKIAINKSLIVIMLLWFSWCSWFLLYTKSWCCIRNGVHLVYIYILNFVLLTKCLKLVHMYFTIQSKIGSIILWKPNKNNVQNSDLMKF